MFSPVGRYEPRRPSGARSSTIVGTRASAPISPPSPSNTLPTTAAATIAAIATGSESASPPCDAGRTRKAPATITSSDTERFAQSRKPSNVPSTRRRSGTGSMPQFGVSVSDKLSSLRRYEPDQVRRVCSQPARGTPVRNRVLTRGAWQVGARHPVRRLRGEEAPDHVREDAAVLQVLALARRVEPEPRSELDVVCANRHLARLAVSDAGDREVLVPGQPE